MKSDIKATSWALGVWGALSIIFGLMIFAWPGITLKVFLIILAIYLLTSGVVMLVGSLVNRAGHWVVGALAGAVSAFAGLYVFANPQISALVALSLIAIWAIVVGVLQIVAGFEGPKKNWLLVIAGAIYTLFGMYIFANPKGGAIAIIWLIGLSVIAGGVVLVISAFKAHELAKELPSPKKA